MTYTAPTAGPRDLVAAIGFAVAVCVAAIIPQVLPPSGCLVVGPLYMLAGLILFIPPRTRPGRRASNPRMTLYMPLRSPQSRWEAR